MTLTSLLGTELPIIQAPMAGAQHHTLAAAVCNAGGLGSLPAAMLSAEALDTQLRELRSLTDRPFNVNFFAHQTPAVDSVRERAWHPLLAPFLAVFEGDPASIRSGPGRQPLSAAMAEVLDALRPSVVSFHFGLPGAQS